MAGGVHVVVLPEHVIDVAVLLIDAPTDDVIAACVGPGELAQLFLLLALQAR
jgi:hypothetical protein